MKRFNTACGLLLFLIVVIATTGRHGGKTDSLAAGFLAVVAVWLTVAVVATACRATAAVGRSLRKGRQAVRQPPAASQSRQVRPPPDVIERLCQQTGMVLVSREADCYQVRNGDHTSKRYIDVTYSERVANVLFQTWLPIRFSLEHEPKGLFARVLLRNGNLHLSSWSMAIGGSCEACLTLVTDMPRAALNAELFSKACWEMVREVNGFQQELHDKFSYEAGGRVVDAPLAGHRDTLDRVQVRETLPNGAVRYRLPRS